MHCPGCGEALVRDFYSGRLCYGCPQCHGCGMTLAGVRKLCGSNAFVNLLWSKVLNESQTGTRQCPFCRKNMQIINLELPDGSVLELDVCCSCQAVWFDARELEALPQNQAAPAPEALLPPKAREALALHKVQNAMAEAAADTEDFGRSDSPDNPWQYLAGILGFPVEQNAPALRKQPLVTYAITAICLAVYALTFNDLAQCIRQWGLIPAQLWRCGGATWISSAFMHGGALHLLGNMYFLLLFGDNVEDLLGRKKYVFLLLVSGLTADMVYLLFCQAPDIPCVGASGFISGIIAAYAVLFPGVKIAFCKFYLYRFFWFSLPAWGMFGLWMIFQCLMAWVGMNGIGGGVAYTAHIGGAIAGLAGGFIARRKMFKPAAGQRPE